MDEDRSLPTRCGLLRPAGARLIQALDVCPALEVRIIQLNGVVLPPAHAADFE